MDNDRYQFLVSDYYATGEGRSVSLLITRAYPQSTDYDDFDQIINTAKFRAAREFIEQFGWYLAQGAENLPRSEFLTRYGKYMSPMIQDILNSAEQPGNFNFCQSLHLNFG